MVLQSRALVKTCGHSEKGSLVDDDGRILGSLGHDMEEQFDGASPASPERHKQPPSKMMGCVSSLSLLSRGSFCPKYRLTR
jgi:hypothetical protein